jgi:hypothetical protein
MENKFALSMPAAFDHQQKQYSTLIRFDDFGAWHYGDTVTVTPLSHTG